MKGGLLLNVVVRKGSAVLKLLTGEDKSLLIWGDTLLVLDLGFHVLDGVRCLDIKGDGLSCESLHEDLHTTTEAEHQVKGRLLLNVVVAEGAAVFELLTGENKTLLIWGNTFLVLDLGFDVLDRVGGLDIKGDGLTSEGLDEDLHTSSKSKDQVKGGLLLDVVVGESSSILKLLSGEDESLLIWWDSLLVLDLGLDVLNGVVGLDLEGPGLSGQGLHEDLHITTQTEHQVKG